MMKRSTKSKRPELAGEAVQQQFLALMRMVAFARNDAAALGADFPAHCLDIAVAALLAELKERGLPSNGNATPAAVGLN